MPNQTQTSPLILASQSPRRRQLLTDAGYDFSVIAPDESVEANPNLDLPPERFVIELAIQKAADVAKRVTDGLILAADTVAVCDGRILGKPDSRADARQMLEFMSGKQHKVLTGVCLWQRPSNRQEVSLEVSTLKMNVLEPAALKEHLDSERWVGKAGAFGFQDGLDWVQLESGLVSNVVGLPIERLPEWIALFAEPLL
jgi:septum formation protein